MVRKQPVDPMKHAAETQAERLRALAEEMRAYAVGRRDESMFNAWANTVQFCSESLTKAVKAEDHGWRDTMLDFAKGTGKLAISTMVTTAVALGVTSAMASDAPPSDGEKLLQCAQSVVEQAEVIEELRHALGSVGAELDTVTANAQGSAFDASVSTTDGAVLDSDGNPFIVGESRVAGSPDDNVFTGVIDGGDPFTEPTRGSTSVSTSAQRPPDPPLNAKSGVHRLRLKPSGTATATIAGVRLDLHLDDHGTVNTLARNESIRDVLVEFEAEESPFGTVKPSSAAMLLSTQDKGGAAQFTRTILHEVRFTDGHNELSVDVSLSDPARPTVTLLLAIV